MSLIRRSASTRWPNGIVPIAIDGASVPTADPIRATINQARQLWQGTAPVTFVDHTNEPDFVLFRRVPHAPRCGSKAVGRAGGRQDILCSGNPSRDRIAHELGHVIGLYHEQQRLDRDAMVAVSGLALRDEPENYRRLDQELRIGPYDFGSLMHYPVDTGPARGMMTKIHPDPMVPATAPSPRDVEGVKFMYGIVLDRTPIAALSRNEGHIELWVVDEFGEVRGAWYDGGWQTWYVSSGRRFPQRGNLACRARDADRMEVWGVGNDGVLHGIWWDGTWQPWYSMAPAPVTSPLPAGTPPLPPGAPLAVHSRHDDHVEIWVVGNDGQVHGIWWNGGAWEKWYTLPGRLFSPGAHLTAVGRNADHMELWAIGTDGRLHGIWWDGDWRSWYSLDAPGAPPLQRGGDVFALSRNEDRIDLWTIGTDDRLHGIWWDGNSWRPWYTLPGPSFQPGAPLTALSREDAHMEVWAVSDAGQLEGVWWDGGAWHPWYVVDRTPVAPGTPPTALRRKAGHMEVFCVGPDDPAIFRRGVQSVFWDGNWNPFFRIT